MTAPTDWQADLDERIAEACGEIHKMTDAKADPFAKAAPRPWLECGHDRGGCDCGQIWSLPADAHIATTLDKWEGGTISRECRIANAALIVAAVNAFNTEREQQIRELIAALRRVSAELALHAGKGAPMKDAAEKALNQAGVALAAFPESE